VPRLIATGDPQAAYDLVRAAPKTETSSRLLVGALNALGRHDDAVAELRDTAARFHDPERLVRAVEILRDTGRYDEAAVLAVEALAAVPPALVVQRLTLHLTLASAAVHAQDWLVLVARSRAWLDEAPTDRRGRWYLAHGLFNSRQYDEAWRSIHETPTLAATTAEEASLWVVIAHHAPPGEARWDEVATLVRRYPDSDVGLRAAVSFFSTPDRVRGDLDAELAAFFTDLINTHAVDAAIADEDAPLVFITGDPEAQIAQMRPALEARAILVESTGVLVRDGLPIGIMASTIGLTYTEALVHKAALCLPIATLDDALFETEKAAARTALASTAVVDLSVLSVGSYLRDLWPLYANAIGRLEIPSPAHADVYLAAEQLKWGSDASVYFDREAQAVTARDTDPAVGDRLREQVTWMQGQLTDLTLTNWPSLVAFPQRPDRADRVAPWLAPLDQAKTQEKVLWCDDIGLRYRALGADVPAFGTVALLAVLAEDSKIGEQQQTVALRRLRDEWAVDLPLDEEWLRGAAAANGWLPGPASIYFSRPVAWLDGETVFPLWWEQVMAAAAEEPVRTLVWLRVACQGLGRTAAAEDVDRLFVELSVRIIVLTSFEPAVIAGSAVVLRQVAEELGIPSPGMALLATVYEHLRTTEDDQAARSAVLSDQLTPTDHAAFTAILAASEPANPEQQA
jgi:tetratricopeptide (TPR) repeat protein